MLNRSTIVTGVAGVIAAGALALAINDTVSPPAPPSSAALSAPAPSFINGDLHVKGSLYLNGRKVSVTVGAQGPAGPRGAQGSEGPAGPEGAAGAQGPAGPQGIQGVPGPQGPTGPSGSPTPPPSTVTPNCGGCATGPLIFDSEFNGSSDPAWSTDRGGPGGKMNNVTTSPADVSISGGSANLTLSNSSTGGYMSTFSSDGGGGFAMTYGYAEARIKLPASGSQLDGWPAWWIVGNNWPADGEADIVEGLGPATSNYHGTTLSRNSGGISGNWYDGGWHTYGVDRLPGENVIYWDGQEVTSYPTSDNGAPEGLILNIGSGQGPTVNGATMQVDYVRVWSQSTGLRLVAPDNRPDHS